MQVRTANTADSESIRQVHLDAFGDEGKTVSELALSLTSDASARPMLTLVAEVDGEVAGSIIFSSVQIEGTEHVSGYILAPLAVAKRFQRSGIGRQLLESGLAALRERGADLVFVLGDPRYYGKFGFTSRHRVRPPYRLAYPDAWMAIALSDLPLETMTGQLVCAHSLMSQEHW